LEVATAEPNESACWRVTSTITDTPPVLQDGPFFGDGAGLLPLTFLFHGLVMHELAGRLFRLPLAISEALS
jgi:hypothetical protein